jgi:succinate dehydrogenase / fumarate reductase, flavoprotein subunit
MGRNEAGLKKALKEIPKIRDEFYADLKLVGDGDGMNQTLEKALRLAEFVDFASLMVEDALNRTESCGGHFREESQSGEGEAMRDDENFSYVAAWEYKGEKEAPELHKESLSFEYCKPSTRSYK